jgi:hypothetical protein
MALQPTPQGIRALLRNAGFASAQPRFLGAVERLNEGYRVHRHGKDAVVVGFILGRDSTGTSVGGTRFEGMLNAYAEVIEAAGWRVRRDVPGYTASLIVSTNEEA